MKLFWKTRRYIRLMYIRFWRRRECNQHILYGVSWGVQSFAHSMNHWLTDWLVCMFTHTVAGNRQRKSSVDNFTKTCHWFAISIWADLDTIVIVLHVPQWLQDCTQLKCVIFSVSMTPPGHNTTKIHVAEAIGQFFFSQATGNSRLQSCKLQRWLKQK